MRLSQFIKENIEPTLEDWESFVRTFVPPAETLSGIALRDHAREILLAIARDIETSQTEDESTSKSQGREDSTMMESETPTTHDALRQLDGFT